MTRSQMLRKLRDWGACGEGYRWVRSTTATSFAELWPLFTRADWMLWLYVRVQPDNRAGRVALALDCAETALPIYERRYPNDMRVRDCIKTGRRWCAGEVTDDELLNASASAASAADDAHDYYAAEADAAAAYAADNDAYTDAAPDAAAYATAGDPYAAAWIAAHLTMCALIRKRVTTVEDR